MRIVHLITGLDCGGAELTLLRLTQRMEWSTQGRVQFQNVVVALTGGPLAEQFHCPVYCLHMKKWQLWKIVSLILLLRKLKPDILQTWLYHADLIGYVASWFIKCKLFWNVRCSDMQDKYSGITQLLACLAERVDKVLFNSQAGYEYHVAQGYHFHSSAIIPNGIDCDQFKPNRPAYRALRRELKLPQNCLLIGMVADVKPMKDYQTFMIAAQALAPHYPVAFLLIGKGTERLPRCVSCYALGHRTDISRLMPALDIFTLCSFSEGMPNVLGEAMACGVPCVASDVGDCAVMLGKDGVIPQGNVQALVNRWTELLKVDKAERKRIGMQGYSRVHKHYSLKTMVERYESCYS